MGFKKIENFNTRKIQKTGGGSYTVTLPIHIMRKFNWKEGQKVVIEEADEGILIRDWEETDE